MELQRSRKTTEVVAMMTIEQMRFRKTVLGLTNEDLAKKSGLPLGTVQKVLAGITKAPRRRTLLKLEQALSTDSDENHPADCVMEPPCAYTAAKHLYTLEDYYALPDDVRVAGFDDVNFASLVSPRLTTMHQPCTEIGATAYRTLLARVENPSLPPRTISLTAPLVIRASTGV